MGKFTKEKKERILKTYGETGSIKETALKEHVSRAAVSGIVAENRDKSLAAENARKTSELDSEGKRFSEYVKLRSSEKSPLEAIAELGLSIQESQQFENQFLRAAMDASAFDLFTKNKVEIANLVAIRDWAARDGISLQRLMIVMKNRKSVKDYLAMLANLEQKIGKKQNQLAELEKQVASSRQTRDTLQKEIVLLQEKKAGLSGTVALLEQRAGQFSRIISDLDEQRRNLEANINALMDKYREAARKVGEELLQNYNRLLDFAFIAVLRALSQCDQFKVWRNLDEIASKGIHDAKPLISAFAAELRLAAWFLQTFLREAGMKVIQGESEPAKDPQPA